MNLHETLTSLKKDIEDNYDIKCYLDGVGVLNKSQCEYPNITIDAESSNVMSNGINRYNLVIYYSDRLFEERDNAKSDYEIWSDADYLLSRIIRRFNLYKNYDFLTVAVEPTIQFFSQEFHDINAGGYVRLSINVKSNANGC